MNLLNRIKKLEDKAAISPSNLPYCVCNGDKPQYQVYVQNGPDSVPMRDGKPLKNESEMCAHCRKPIVRQVIIVDTVPSGHPLPPDVATFRIDTKGAEL